MCCVKSCLLSSFTLTPIRSCSLQHILTCARYIHSLASFPNQIGGSGNEARGNLKITVERCRVSCYGILCAAEFNWRDALNLESQLTEEEIRIR